MNAGTAKEPTTPPPTDELLSFNKDHGEKLNLNQEKLEMIMQIIKLISEIYAELHAKDKNSMGNCTASARRQPRAVPLLAVGLWTLGASGVVGASKLLATAVERWNPESAQNRVGRLEKVFEEERQRIERFETNFNITKYVLDNALSSVETVAKQVSALEQRLGRLSEELPRVIWYFVDAKIHIRATADRLDRVIKSYRRGKLATFEVGQLFKDDRLKQTKEEHTQLIKASIVGKSTFALDAAVVELYKDTSIFEIEAFDHWANLTTRPIRLHYEGSRYMVYNISANCVRGIESPKKLNDERCEETDFIDWKLKVWSETLDDPEAVARRTEPHVLKGVPLTTLSASTGKSV